VDGWIDEMNIVGLTSRNYPYIVAMYTIRMREYGGVVLFFERREDRRPEREEIIRGY
jgi:hypothetical protein